jgi:hypothetical protein
VYNRLLDHASMRSSGLGDAAPACNRCGACGKSVANSTSDETGTEIVSSRAADTGIPLWEAARAGHSAPVPDAAAELLAAVGAGRFACILADPP